MKILLAAPTVDLTLKDKVRRAVAKGGTKRRAAVFLPLFRRFVSKTSSQRVKLENVSAHFRFVFHRCHRCLCRCASVEGQDGARSREAVREAVDRRPPREGIVPPLLLRPLVPLAAPITGRSSSPFPRPTPLPSSQWVRRRHPSAARTKRRRYGAARNRHVVLCRSTAAQQQLILFVRVCRSAGRGGKLSPPPSACNCSASPSMLFLCAWM